MPHSDRSRQLKAELLLLLFVFIWAANYPLAKYCLSGMSIFVFNGIRYIVAGMVLALLVLWRSSWSPVVRSDWKRLLEAGFVANIVYQLAFIIGLSMTTAGNSAVLLSTSPLWTVMFQSRLHKEHVLPKVWLGLIVSFIGVVMIIIGSGKKLEIGGTALIGDVISLLAAILWAWNTNLQKPLLSKYSATQLSFIMVLVGSIGLSIIAIPGAIETEWSVLHWTFIAGAVASGVLSIGLANAVWSYGVKHIGPGRTAVFSNLTPVIAFVLSYLALHEQLVPVQVAGAAVTVLGVWIVRR